MIITSTGTSQLLFSLLYKMKLRCHLTVVMFFFSGALGTGPPNCLSISATSDRGWGAFDIQQGVMIVTNRLFQMVPQLGCLTAFFHRPKTPDGSTIEDGFNLGERWSFFVYPKSNSRELFVYLPKCLNPPRVTQLCR